jgi:hypothetical protein
MAKLSITIAVGLMHKRHGLSVLGTARNAAGLRGLEQLMRLT